MTVVPAPGSRLIVQPAAGLLDEPLEQRQPEVAVGAGALAVAGVEALAVVADDEADRPGGGHVTRDAIESASACAWTLRIASRAAR